MKTSGDDKQIVNYRHILQRIKFTRKGLPEEVSNKYEGCRNQNKKINLQLRFAINYQQFVLNKTAY